MPSATDKPDDPGPDVKELKPISGTGLRIPSLQKILQANGDSSNTSPEANPPKQYRAPIAKKPTARPPAHQSASMPLLASQSPVLKPDAPVADGRDHGAKLGDDDFHSSLFAQVYGWLQHEKARRKARKSKVSAMPAVDGPGDDEDADTPLERISSGSSEGAFALDQLERILVQHATSLKESNHGSGHGTRRSARRRPGMGLRRSASASESDYPDFDAAVPSVDASLDNSKTLAYSGGAADDDGMSTSTKRAKEKEHWLTFKTEIVRIAHTLRLRGWRSKVPLENAGDIEVTRLSGALTNAVYVVAPPKHMPPKTEQNEDGTPKLVPRKPPPKLLLRIYGPQVDHLIDRENELQILRRLGRKNIGPKVLGTFNNGRFEEYFEARPLTARELRIPETSKQIAKRMRELHEGIELLEEEREGGPVVFKNWDKWVDRCEQVINWLDREILSEHNEIKAQSEAWRRRGFVCGVPWPVFRKAVETYRQWLVTNCGGVNEIKRQLIFAHNDTQYGNLLRLEPSGESPLLLPANEHKQLVVIDFEYASANTPGFEFANHFSEWCYNYHDPERSWACNVRGYPTPEEQRRFIYAYLKHRPGFGGRAAASPYATPSMRAASSSTPQLAPLDLDAGPNAQTSPNDAEKPREDALEDEVQYLLWQTRLWRAINSAQWVAWGIVQAKVPGMEEGIAAGSAPESSDPEATTSTTRQPPVDADMDESDEFDYLAYAQDRAFFFWSDLLSLSLIKEEELPGVLVAHIKARMIDY